MEEQTLMVTTNSHCWPNYKCGFYRSPGSRQHSSAELTGVSHIKIVQWSILLLSLGLLHFRVIGKTISVTKLWGQKYQPSLLYPSALPIFVLSSHLKQDFDWWRNNDMSRVQWPFFHVSKRLIKDSMIISKFYSYNSLLNWKKFNIGRWACLSRFLVMLVTHAHSDVSSQYCCCTSTTDCHEIKSW